MLKAMSLAELQVITEREKKALRASIKARTKRWGPWRYDGSKPASLHAGEYWFELSRINSHAKLGDWVRHIAEKVWGTPEVIGQLVMAVRDLEYAGLLKYDHTNEGQTKYERAAPPVLEARPSPPTQGSE